MVIYSDAANNKYIGDCIYNFHNISYPTIPHLVGFPNSGISAELTAWLTASGGTFRTVLDQPSFETNAGVVKSMFLWGNSNDTIDDRYTFALDSLGTYVSGGSLNAGISILYNDVGCSFTDGTLNSAQNGQSPNAVLNVSEGSVGSGVSPIEGAPRGLQMQVAPPSTHTEIYWAGVSSALNKGLFVYQKNLQANTVNYAFWYGGELVDVNTNYNYYNQSIIFRSGLFFNRSGGVFVSEDAVNDATGGHRTSTGKSFLNTGEAQYTIACSDGQIPGPRWATDLYVFEDNPDIGNPAIGRVQNILVATGTFKIGEVVRINGSVFPDPDNGSNAWLPVSTWAGKTLLMRCYTSTPFP